MITQGQYANAPNQPGYRVFYGWKLHLGAHPSNHSMVFAYLTSLVDRYYVGWKYGKNSGQIGKDFTIYIGPRRLTEKIATDIQNDIGHLLDKVAGDALYGNFSFSSCVSGRYDIQLLPRTEDPIFGASTVFGVFNRTFTKLGVPIFEQAVRDRLWNTEAKMELWTIYSDRVACDKFGTHYYGKNPNWLLDYLVKVTP